MDFSDSSEEENNDFENWNDWRPPVYLDSMDSKEEISKVLLGSGSSSKNEKSVTLRNITDRFANWIPPSDLHNRFDSVKYMRKSSMRKKRLTIPRGCSEVDDVNTPNSADKSKVSGKIINNILDEPKMGNDITDNVFKVQRYLDKTSFNPLSDSKYFDQSILDNLDESSIKKTLSSFDTDRNWEKIINLDWGKRIELHDVTNFSNGDSMWGVVCPGVFASIKLWRNECGNICGLAEGKISKEGASETTSIFITDISNLRKMLQLTTNQWSSLVEMMQKGKITLNFEAINEANLQKMNFLEKLWYYTCRRRHFLPDQCMLVKFLGAIKSLRDFKIIPKLIVQEIRDISGKDLL